MTYKAAGPATKLVYTTVPNTGTAGTAFSVTVQSQDANGNPASPTSSTTITLSRASGGGTLSGTLTGSIATNASSATLATPVYSKSDTMTLMAMATTGETSLTAVTSGNIVFSPGALANYLVSAAPTIRGTSFTVTVTARDANGNTVTTATTPVTLTSSTVNVQFTGNPATPSSGTFTISALDNYFETVTLTATDTNSITGNTSVTINPLSGDYRSQANGGWSTAGTWQTWSGSAWTAASSAPASATTNQISVLSGNTVTVTTSVTAQNLNIASGGTVAINSTFTLTVNNGVANGVISGAGILVESGTGNLLDLNGANTYTGGTVINSGGTVSINSDGNLGNTSGGITFNGGTLQTTGSSAITTARTVTLGTGGGTVSLGVPLWFSGGITGGTGLTTGGNDVILSRASGNNVIGAITVNSGRLFVFSGTNNIAGSTIAVQSGATLDFNITGGAAYVNATTFASGSCLANRVGTLTVSTANVTFPTSGTMIFNQDDQVSTAITVNGAYPVLTGPLTIQIGAINATVGTVTLSGAISGSMALPRLPSARSSSVRPTLTPAAPWSVRAYSMPMWPAALAPVT